jgi:HEAT repeat protein
VPGAGSSGPSTPAEGSTRADPADWRTWWRFNSEALLDLKTLVGQHDRRTGGGEFGLGAGESQGSPGLTQATIETEVLPALWSALQAGGDTQLVRNAMFALARVEATWRVPDGQGFTFAATKMLASPHAPTAEAAIVALGVTGKSQGLGLLFEILSDSEKGRQAIGKPAVDYRRRAFAAYALALVGRSESSPAVRKSIVRALMQNLDARATAPYDVQLASLISLGLVPLDSHAEEVASEADPQHLCRGEQLNFLLDYLDDERRHPQLRAQAVIPLARLAQGAPDADYDAIRGALIVPLGARSKAPLEVKQSCVIGLGLLGDGDEDELDRELRSTLYRAAAHEDRLTRALALISLAKVVGRPGKGAQDGKSLVEAEEYLLGKLVRGDTSQRAWAALSLGVLGCTLNDHGRTTPREIAAALRGALATARSKDELGAQCLGLGLLRDSESGATLAARLESSKDDGTRACAALAAGLVDAEAAMDPLRQMIAASTSANEVFVSAALALRIAGHSEVSLALAERATRKPSTDATDDLARLLGHLGDARTVDELAALARDASAKPQVRAAACEALGEICDTRSRHWTSALSTDLHYGLMSSTLLSFGSDGTGVLEMR